MAFTKTRKNFWFSRKFKCPYCEFATIQSQSVTQHVMTSHPGSAPDVVTFSADDLERKVQENILRSGDDALRAPASAASAPAKSSSSSSLVAIRPSPVMQAVHNIAKKYTSYTPAINIIQRKSQLGISKKKKYLVDESVCRAS